MYFRRYDLCGKDSVDATAFAYAEKKKPMTNADRIRGMTDEELAEWIKLMVCKYRSCGNCPMSDWCEPDKGIAEWLKAPVEERE